MPVDVALADFFTMLILFRPDAVAQLLFRRATLLLFTTLRCSLSAIPLFRHAARARSYLLMLIYFDAPLMFYDESTLFMRSAIISLDIILKMMIIVI